MLTTSTCQLNVHVAVFNNRIVGIESKYWLLIFPVPIVRLNNLMLMMIMMMMMMMLMMMTTTIIQLNVQWPYNLSTATYHNI